MEDTYETLLGSWPVAFCTMRALSRKLARMDVF